MFLLALAAAQTFAAGTPAFDPRVHKKEIAGQPAEILVLGTMHLSQLPHPVDPKLFDPLLDRLAKFDPQIITVEGLSGEECEVLRGFKSQHGADTWDTYCWPTDEMEKATGLNVSQALAKADAMLAYWPASPSAAQRRHLAKLFLAANDRGSAMVQWLRLPEAERRLGDGLTQTMVDVLERKGKPLNENYTIAAALAARLGLERIYEVDDHTADTPFDEKSPQGQAYAAAIQGAWKARPAPAVRAEEERMEANLRTSGDVIAIYRLLNQPKTQRETIASDMGRNAAYPSAQLYGRQYVAWWETRPLRIAANIRTTLQQNPQGRVLSIIGATHKGYLDAYLDMMQDVRLVDAMQFLR